MSPSDNVQLAIRRLPSSRFRGMAQVATMLRFAGFVILALGATGAAIVGVDLHADHVDGALVVGYVVASMITVVLAGGFAMGAGYFLDLALEVANDIHTAVEVYMEDDDE